MSLSSNISTLIIEKDIIKLIKKNIADIAGAEKSKKAPKEKHKNPHSFDSKLSNFFKSIATQNANCFKYIL